MKKALLISIVLFAVLVSVPLQALAVGEFTVHEVYDPNSIVTTPLHYNSSNDSVDVYISGQKAVKVYYASYPDSTYTTPTTDKYLYPSQYGWDFFTGMAFNCNTYYEGILFDINDNVLLRVKVHVTGLVNPACDSTSGGAQQGGQDDLSQLTDINNTILNAVNSNGETLKSILKGVTDTNLKLDSILGELQTDNSPIYPSSPTVPTLEENKPTQPETVYIDNTVYFTDQGDAEPPPALPTAPEPERWKNLSGVEIIPDVEMVKEPSFVPDAVLTPESVLTSDTVLIPDVEMVKDTVPIKDAEMVQSPILVPDTVKTKDTVLIADPVPTKTPIDDTFPTWKQ